MLDCSIWFSSYFARKIETDIISLSSNFDFTGMREKTLCRLSRFIYSNVRINIRIITVHAYDVQISIRRIPECYNKLWYKQWTNNFSWKKKQIFIFPTLNFFTWEVPLNQLYHSLLNILYTGFNLRFVQPNVLK